MSAEQVLTNQSDEQRDFVGGNQLITASADAALGTPASLLDHIPHQSDAAIPIETEQRTPTYQTKAFHVRGYRKRKGGWRASPGLRWSDVKAIFELASVAGLRGFGFTHFISIMPAGGSDMERKRVCSRVIAHLGQAIHRRGHPHIGVTVYEKGCADLHAHHLVHVPRGEEKLLAHLSNRPTRRVRRAAPTDVGYITKERLPLPPEFEKRVSHWRKKGALLPGKRWSATKGALALLADDTASATSSAPIQGSKG
jgi:hypothetical protein